MTSVWLLALFGLLAWLLVKVRRARLLAIALADHKQAPDKNHISALELGDFVREMSGTLEPSSKVLSPNYPTESSHVWDSPSGKRVYMN